MNERGTTRHETIEQQTPKTSAYLATKNLELRDRHAHCGVMSENVARLLIEDGRQPQIEQVYEEVRGEDGRTRVKSFLPEQYRGKLEPWHGHFVCCADGYAFDPIIGRPVPKDDYTRLAFGEEIKMKISSSPDELKRHLHIES